MYKILIVEDDKNILDGIINVISGWQMEARGIRDFRNVMKEFAEYGPHLVLLDISLPAFDGYYWCNEIRKQSKVPIIFLSSAAENMNIIMAMNMGADDFVAKPFNESVLMAKLQALLRRTYDFSEGVSMIEHRDAILNLGDHTLNYQDKKLELSSNEYKILFTLMKAKGQIVSREKLMEVLWESEVFIDENTLTVNINRLRKKLAEIGLTDFIVTKFGVGYILG